MLSAYAYPFSKIAVKWRDLTWRPGSPKFSLHHLQKISTGFKMAVLTAKSGIDYIYCSLVSFTLPSVFHFFCVCNVNFEKIFLYSMMLNP